MAVAAAAQVDHDGARRGGECCDYRVVGNGVYPAYPLAETGEGVVHHPFA